MHSQFLIGSYTESPELIHALETSLVEQNYRICIEQSQETLLDWITQNRHRVDCVVLEAPSRASDILETLQSRSILLPVLVVDMSETTAAENADTSPDSESGSSEQATEGYHSKVVCIGREDVAQVERYIHQAIQQFLQLPYDCDSDAVLSPSTKDTQDFLLSLQQQRLTEKLQERLGYLGVYYKRDPGNFLRNLSQEARADVLRKVRAHYRKIVLSYFNQSVSLNQEIDNFVNRAFFADISASKIVEVHMELMESFSKQLKLEGRNEEILLDYRLTLIDVIAHLCEMYRRSIPREM